MKELSLHILDIIQNSIAAGATLITLTLYESVREDILTFTIADNGCGMPEEMVRAVTDPFTTGRTTRKVGLGIPLLKTAAEQTGGKIRLSSAVGKGTTVTADFTYSHIDRQPLGNMAETMLGLITSHPDLDFVYQHRVENTQYTLDTREMRKTLGDVPLNENAVTLWLSDFLKENEAALWNHEN